MLKLPYPKKLIGKSKPSIEKFTWLYSNHVNIALADIIKALENTPSNGIGKF
jgi:hypothetical protein